MDGPTDADNKEKNCTTPIIVALFITLGELLMEHPRRVNS